MTIAAGDKLPETTFLEKGADGIGPVAGADLFAGRRVALFGLPGAFTGICSAQHLPSFIRVADKLRAKGIDEVVCVSVNDPHVMKAWGESAGAQAVGIRMLADAAGDFSSAMGLTFDAPASGLLRRSKRYALLAEDGVVKILNLEPPGAQCEVSAGETLLDQI